MRGISSIISIVLLLMIVIAFTAAFFIFSSRMFVVTQNQASESINRTAGSMQLCLKFESASANNIYVRNCGPSQIHNNTISVYVDGSSVLFSIPASINPDEIGTITILQVLAAGNHDVKVSGAGYDINENIWISGGSVTTTISSTTTSIPSTTLVTTTLVSTTTISGTTTSSTTSTTISLTGLLGYWKFNSTVGTSAADSSSSGFNGTLINMNSTTSWVQGISGNALSFNGLNGYVRVNDTNALKYKGGNFSISLFFRPNSTENDTGYLISKPWNGNGEYDYYLRYNSDGSLYFSISGNTRYGITIPVKSFQDYWNHVVITVSSDSTIKAYFYGSNVIETPHNISNWNPPNSDLNLSLAIGTLYPYGSGWSGNSAYSFKGLIDEVQIFNRTLSSDEVSGIFEKYYLNFNITTTGNITLYPWEPTDFVGLFPFDYKVLSNPSNNISISACRGEYEPASFFIHSINNVSGFFVSSSNLYGSSGNFIPSSAVDIKLVKDWYQADDDNIYITHGIRYLVQELLVNDDTLVRVDYVNRTNYLKVNLSGITQYVDIGNPNATFSNNSEIYDAQTLQPFSIGANGNKQVWITLHVPNNTASGNYSGNITVALPSGDTTIMRLDVNVLPFELEPSPLEYSIYYRGIIPSSPQPGINSEYKTLSQYSLEIQNMKEHGVLYPTMYQPNNTMLSTALSIRNQSGIPKDHIYLLGLSTGNSTNATVLANLAASVVRWKNITSLYGFNEIYVYGIDERTGDALLSERTAWETVHNAGAKIYVACYTDAFSLVGDLLDVAILCCNLNSSQAANWHSTGKKIFNYANPQGGAPTPESYRINYGFRLWNSGYDGAMDYAYQHSFGHIWNDFDDPYQHYSDHTFAYPTSNGLIDTVEWEGFREAVDDTRYIATLSKLTGTNYTASTIINNSMAIGEKPSVIRKRIIDRILEITG